MTCIVGINTGQKIIIAGDRMGSNGFVCLQSKEPKVFKKDDFIFGVCGSYRVMQLLNYKFTAPKKYIDQTTNNYIFTTFVDSVFKLLDDNNALQTENNLKTFKGAFLFGYQEELYQMHSNFQIIVNNRNYDATGSGCHHAISSLYSTEGLNINPRDRLKKAINCANEFVMSVDNTIDVVELTYKKEKTTRKK